MVGKKKDGIKRRISIDFSPEELELIRYLKGKKKTTGRDIIQRAIWGPHPPICSHCGNTIC